MHSLLLFMMLSYYSLGKSTYDACEFVTSFQLLEKEVEKLKDMVEKSLERRIVSTDKAPNAIGPYNQAVQIGDTLYLSGQLGLVPDTMKIIEGGVEAETEQALQNISNSSNISNQQ